jgi:hypothetical protein
MARAVRDTAPGCIHHVVNRGNRRQVIFHTPGDYKAFIKVLADAPAKLDVRPGFGTQFINNTTLRKGEAVTEEDLRAK